MLSKISQLTCHGKEPGAALLPPTIREYLFEEVNNLLPHIVKLLKLDN